MGPGTFNLRLYRGDTFRVRFELWWDWKREVPLVLHAATARTQIRNRPAGNIVAEGTCSIEDPNFIVMEFPAAETQRLPVTGSMTRNWRGVWDLQVRFENDDVMTVLAGSVDVRADVTDSEVIDGTATHDRWCRCQRCRSIGRSGWAATAPHLEVVA